MSLDDLMRIEESLRRMSDRQSEEAINLAKDYAKMTETVCSQVMNTPGGVDKCIGLWQTAHILIFDMDAENSSGQSHHLRHPEFITFLCAFAAFFAKLSSPNKEFNQTLLQKRIQIYEQALELIYLYPEHELPMPLKEVTPFLLRQRGTCFFKLQDMEQAYTSLLQVTQMYKLPETITMADAPIVMKYVEAVLEATECLKVQKKNEEAIQRYSEVLKLYDTLNEVGAAVPLDCIGGVCNNIAMCYYHSFNYAATLPYFERALAAYETMYGPNIPAVAMIRGNIQTNKQLAAMMEQFPPGANITKMDLTNHRPMEPDQEKETYFTEKK